MKANQHAKRSAGEASDALFHINRSLVIGDVDDVADRLQPVQRAMIQTWAWESVYDVVSDLDQMLNELGFDPNWN